jgi:hypothetical protein
MSFVHFQDVTQGDHLFRIAEYRASGFFHNSQIVKLDHEREEITFQFRSWMESGSRHKSYRLLTLSVYEFIARMLYYLPEHYKKEIRYNGLYSPRYHRTTTPEKATWSDCIERSFGENPNICPDCGHEMDVKVYYRFQANSAWNEIVRIPNLAGGYFRPIRPP